MAQAGVDAVFDCAGGSLPDQQECPAKPHINAGMPRTEETTGSFNTGHTHNNCSAASYSPTG
ncbi:hypothetical protein, partial [Streptomyces sp. NRRL F-5135]|uniref:hypothetical protein n=1 Tax=Streptomyces sp. NRRL F-5135 TaxID=1463858 RepID=UPI001F26BF4C